MKERPILFTGAMVRALLAGTKTQTRRVVNPQPVHRLIDVPSPPKSSHCPEGGRAEWYDTNGVHPGTIVKCPYGGPGDRLWSKETHWRYGKWRKNGVSAKGRQKWKFQAMDHDLGVQFAAPEPPPKRGKRGWHKRPSIFMPRLASRLTLEITNIRVERLQDISEEDARAEGAQQWGDNDGAFRKGYEIIWETINGLGSWDLNPYVWAITFKIVTNT